MGKPLVGLMNKTNWQQTNREHRYKYTGIMGKSGDTWRRVETITKTGATDQGVTLTEWCIEAVCSENRGLCCINVKQTFFSH
jgi:hypothetical protein